MDNFDHLFEAAPRVDRTSSAATRQKSCNACVRGKRRCDKKTPRCTRCGAKGLDCIYQRLPPSAPSGSDSSSSSSGAGGINVTPSPFAAADQDQFRDSERDLPSIVDIPPDFDMGFDLDSLSTGSASNATPDSNHIDVGLQLDPGLVEFNIADLLAGDPMSGHQMWASFDVGAAANNKLQPQPPPAFQPVRDLAVLQRATDQCVDQCPSMDPIQVHDPRSKPGFVIGYITNMHAEFSRTRALPFIHQRLWAASAPRTMVAAFAACSAYLARTPENRAWAMRVLADSAREVHRDGEHAVSHADRLARVQALLVLNSIRIFDGDVTARAMAEREMPVMSAWLKDLMSAIEELEESEGPSFAKEHPPKSWDVSHPTPSADTATTTAETQALTRSQAWILLESMRRTSIFCMAFVCMLAVLKGDTRTATTWLSPFIARPLTDIATAEPDQMWFDGAAYTASRHLWDAPSSVEFYRAWREKPQYPIKSFSFREFWMYARPEDMDEFTKLFLTA